MNDRGPDPDPVAVFVSATGNAFMTDLAGWIVEAARELGRPAELVADGRLPHDPACVNLVVAPHEFYWLSDADDAEIDHAASISVPVCTEQPGTTWFEMTSLLCSSSPAVLDINRHGVAALRADGHEAHHLRIGGVPSMDRRRNDTPRPIDLVFLGGRTEHRTRRLAELAPLLWARRADIRLFSFTRPVEAGVGGLVFGDEKYDLLASSEMMVNLHRDGAAASTGGAGYFEWARLVEAMANGVAIVTEPSTGFEPLQPDEHFVMTDDLVGAVERLLADPARVRAIGDRAASAVLDRFPLRDSLAEALSKIERSHIEPSRTEPSRRRRPRYRSRLRRAQQIPLLPAFRPNTAIRRRVQDSWAAEVDLQRRLEAARSELLHGEPAYTERVTSRSYKSAEPEVSVVVTLFDYAHLVSETLDSIVASQDVVAEIIVVDDHSRDAGRSVVREFIDTNPDVPVLLLGSEVNRGLPGSRNAGVAAARADLVMMMDADNLVYPTCLRRLADALAADPDASFAYSILEEFGQRTGLQSAMGWHVPWLCEANYIDAQAMVRRSVFERHGGYRSGSPLVFGWEDWELWLRLAAAGEWGVHVPQILGRYRTQAESMIATSNLFGDLMLESLRQLHPTLPWPDS